MDEDRRAAERDWERDPTDQAAVHRFIEAQRRARRPLSRELLESRRFPPCRIPLRATGFRISPKGVTSEGPIRVIHRAGQVEIDYEHTALEVGTTGSHGPVDFEGLVRDLARVETPLEVALHGKIGQLPDDPLVPLGRLPALEVLDIGRTPLYVFTPVVTDRQFESFAGHGRLRALRLRTHERLGPEGFRHLGRIPWLQSLIVSATDEVTVADLGSLAALEVLESLRLGRVQGASLAAILSALGDLPALERLDLRDSELVPGKLLPGARLPRLRGLEATWPSRGDSERAVILALSSLETLTVDEDALGGNDFVAACADSLPELRDLSLRHASSFAGLERLVKLEALTIVGPRVRVDARRIASLPELRRLSLAALGDLKPKDLAPLALAPRLEELFISSSEGFYSDTDVKRLLRKVKVHVQAPESPQDDDWRINGI